MHRDTSRPSRLWRTRSPGCPGWRWRGRCCAGLVYLRASPARTPPRSASLRTSVPGCPRWEDETMARLDYAALNSTICYTMWSVFRVEPGRLPADRAEPAREAQQYFEMLEG